MKPATTEQPCPIERIPDPECVRSRLAQNASEYRLLRRLLRLAEQAAKERPRRREELAHAG